jgi:hypothetical protein
LADPQYLVKDFKPKHMKLTRILSVSAVLALSASTFFIACTKGTTPISPPIHDTIYSPKPDTTVNLTKGLLVYLPFSGNIADSSGNGNTTTAYGSPLTWDAHGYTTSAFGATGLGNTEVFVTNNGSIKYDTAFTVSFGFMVNDSNATQSFISMINPTNGAGSSFNIGLTDPYSNHFCFGVGDVTDGCDGLITNNVIDTANLTPVPGSWYSCICAYQKGGVKVYINGTLIGQKQSQWTKANNCPDAQLVVGGWWNSGNRLNINGKMDNIRLYNRVLTPNEIATLSIHYQMTSNGIEPGLQTN